MTAVGLRFSLPDSQLRDLISSYYFVDLPEGMSIADQLVPEWGNIRLILTGNWTAQLIGGAQMAVPDAVLVGFTSRAATIRSSGASRVVGIGLLPKGWIRLIGQDADDYADRICDLVQAYGKSAAELLSRARQCRDDSETVSVLDSFFLKVLSLRPEVPTIVDIGLSALMDETVTTVEAFSQRLNLSPRQAARTCRKYFGFAPKLLLRRQRFLRTFSILRKQKSGTWIDHLGVAYTDQSHFIREFRYFMNMSPSAYFGNDHSIIAKAADLRQKFLGASVQGLHHASEDQ